MKLKNILRNVTAMALPLALLGSCTGDFEELNTNPYEIDPEELPFEAQFSTPLSFSYPTHQNLFQYWTSLSIDNYGGYFEVPHSNWTMARYDLARGFCGGMHENFMQKIFNNTRRLIKQCDAAGQHDFAAVARIVEAYNLLQYTDTYGPVPYSSVLAADELAERPSSYAYDKQEDIYMDFLSELRAASAQLDVSAMAPQNDLYFNGDIEKWRRFANSLWLRISMRLLKVNPTLAQQEAKAAYEAGVMTSNSDICYVAHESSRLDEGPGNGFANQMLEDPTYSNYRMTNELLEALTSTNDPRTLYIGGAYYTDSKRTDITSIVYEKTGSYQGVPAQDFIYNAWAPALTINIDGKDVSVAHHYQKMQPSKLLTDPASPYMHLTYAETEFYLAEAAARHWNVSSESAKEHYKKGLVAAIKQWSLFGANVPDDATLEALAEEQSSLLDAGDTEALEEINKQLWLLYILDPIEAWSNIRRSGMPSKYTKFYNLAPTENESDGKRPNRMMYPLEEQIKNKENLEEALSRMGGTDNWTSRVWWDKE